MDLNWRHSKSKIAIAVILMLLMTMLSTVAFAASPSDISEHWAKIQIEQGIERGFVNGYPGGTFKPDNPISRAEFMVMTNTAFGFTDSTSTNYSDVKAGDWFAADIAKAKAAGYIAGYEDGTIRPDKPISRQEAASILARILSLEPANASGTLQKFSDSHLFPAWSKDSIAAMLEKGYLTGYPDNTFNPVNSIKRAEAVAVLNAVYGNKAPETPAPVKPSSSYTKAGTYGPQTGIQTIKENVTISAGGVILKNTIITGDLTIAEAVANGDVTLENVKVQGTAYINGGGPNSITLNGCELNKVVVNKKDGKIRIVLSKDSSVKSLTAQSGLKLEGQGTITDLTINSSGVEIEPKTVNQPSIKNGVTAKVGGAAIGATSSGSGGGGGGSSTVTAASVSTAAELTAALNNSNITSITLTANIAANPSVTRSLTMNLGGHTLTGNLSFAHNGTGTSVLTGNAGNRITGALTVNTPNASFTNGVAVTGAVNIINVASASWTETADGNTLTITDPDGATITITGSPSSVTVTQDAGGTLTLTVNPGASVTNITTNVPINIQVSAGATVTEITAQPGAAGTTVNNNGTTGTLTANDTVNLTVGSTGSVSTISGSEAGTVNTISVSDIAVTPTTLTLTAGGATATITAAISPVNATNKGVTWSSSNQAVATVAGGVVTPAAQGTAIITATSVADGTKTAATAVTVNATQGTTPTITSLTTTKDEVTITFSQNIEAINMPNSITFASGAYDFDLYMHAGMATIIRFGHYGLLEQTGNTMKIAVFGDYGALSANYYDFKLYTGDSMTPTIIAQSDDFTFQPWNDTPVDIDPFITESTEIWVTVDDTTLSEFMTGLVEADFALFDAAGNRVEVNFQTGPEIDQYNPDTEYRLTPVSGVFDGVYRVRFAKSGYNPTYAELSVGGGAFTPGEGGTLPAFTPFTEEAGEIGGLYITKNERLIVFYFNGRPVIRNRVEMQFLPPSSFGATGYILQFSEDSGSTWNNLPWDGADLQTSSDTQDNFSLENPGGNYHYRLLVVGGDKNGYTSNVVEAELTNVLSAYTGWSLDESMSLTGVIAPYVGRGLEASFTSTKYIVDGNNNVSDAVYTDEHMFYQWYRVNPVTYQMTGIQGATERTYTTTEDDLGYALLIRATGDGIDVGGYAQIISTWGVVMPNEAYVTNVTETGFTLNLYKEVSGLTVDDLTLYDRVFNQATNSYGEVTIDSVTPGANNAIFNITANMPAASGPYFLYSDSDFWHIVAEGPSGHMMMGIEIE